MVKSLSFGSARSQTLSYWSFQRQDQYVVVIQTLEALQICFKVSELTEQRLERLEISADTVLQELAKLAFANMGDYLSVGADGSITVDVSRITSARGAALAERHLSAWSGN